MNFWYLLHKCLLQILGDIDIQSCCLPGWCMCLHCGKDQHHKGQELLDLEGKLREL